MPFYVRERKAHVSAILHDDVLHPSLADTPGDPHEPVLLRRVLLSYADVCHVILSDHSAIDNRGDLPTGCGHLDRPQAHASPEFDSPCDPDLGSRDLLLMDTHEPRMEAIQRWAVRLHSDRDGDRMHFQRVQYQVKYPAILSEDEKVHAIQNEA